MTDGFSDGSVVATSPTFIGRNGVMRMADATAAAASVARATANGMILTVATIWPAVTDAYSGTVAMVIAGSMRLRRSTLGAIDDRDTGRVGNEIGATGERPLGAHPLARQRGDDGRCGIVLVDVAGIEPGHHDFRNTSSRERGDVIRGQRRAFAERAAAQPDRVRENCARCVCDRHRTELHAAASFAAVPRLRSVAMISARIETAISAGDCAPMARPMGPRMRAT